MERTPSCHVTRCHERTCLSCQHGVPVCCVHYIVHIAVTFAVHRRPVDMTHAVTLVCWHGVARDFDMLICWVWARVTQTCLHAVTLRLGHRRHCRADFVVPCTVAFGADFLHGLVLSCLETCASCCPRCRDCMYAPHSHDHSLVYHFCVVWQHCLAAFLWQHLCVLSWPNDAYCTLLAKWPSHAQGLGINLPRVTP